MTIRSTHCCRLPPPWQSPAGTSPRAILAWQATGARGPEPVAGASARGPKVGAPSPRWAESLAYAAAPLDLDWDRDGEPPIAGRDDLGLGGSVDAGQRSDLPSGAGGERERHCARGLPRALPRTAQRQRLLGRPQQVRPSEARGRGLSGLAFASYGLRAQYLRHGPQGRFECPLRPGVGEGGMFPRKENPTFRLDQISV